MSQTEHHFDGRVKELNEESIKTMPSFDMSERYYGLRLKSGVAPIYKSYTWRPSKADENKVTNLDLNINSWSVVNNEDIKIAFLESMKAFLRLFQRKN